MKNGIAVIIFIPLLLQLSCSSVKSIKQPEEKDMDGLIYYMPKKDILVVVNVAEKGEGEGKVIEVDRIDISETAAYPDLSEKFVLKHQNNLLGKNELNVGVGLNGLLQSTKSITTSSVNQAFINLAETLGYLAPLGAAPVCSIGEHSFIYHPDNANPPKACGMPVKIERLSVSDGQGTGKNKGEKVSGVFYKQNIPYQVTVTGGAISKSAIVFSPSGSPTYFMPVSGTFFSDNKADFGFVDGIPNKYDQTTDGELVALFKLPADIIGAYFGAVGRIFDSFKTADQKKAEALTQEVQLALREQKVKNCMAAIKTGNQPDIESLGCEE